METGTNCTMEREIKQWRGGEQVGEDNREWGHNVDYGIDGARVGELILTHSTITRPTFIYNTVYMLQTT